MNPGQILIIRNTFILYLLAILFSPFIYYENTKTYLPFYLHIYLPVYTLFVITIIISTFILQSPPPSWFLFALLFPICFASLSLLQN